MEFPKKWLSAIFLALTFTLIAGAAATTKLHCSICGMDFTPTAKTSFASVHKGKPIHFCSFTCASRFHKKYPEEALSALDFLTGSKLETKSAYFLIRSKNILKELEFDMPPSVVAFKTSAAAKKTQARLGDGEVVQGLGALEKAYD
jgi:YHS domain-containing protein